PYLDTVRAQATGGGAGHRGNWRHEMIEGALALRAAPPPLPDEAPAKKLRILYHHRVVSRDGQSVHVDDMIAALRGLGDEIAIAAPGTPEGQGAEPPRWIAWLKR